MSYSKKTGVLISVVMLLIALGGCGKRESSAPNVGSYSNFDTSWKKTVFVEDDTLNVPMAMVYAGDSLYVVSREGNCMCIN